MVKYLDIIIILSHQTDVTTLRPSKTIRDWFKHSLFSSFIRDHSDRFSLFDL